MEYELVTALLLRVRHIRQGVDLVTLLRGVDKFFPWNLKMQHQST